MKITPSLRLAVKMRRLTQADDFNFIAQCIATASGLTAAMLLIIFNVVFP